MLVISKNGRVLFGLAGALLVLTLCACFAAPSDVVNSAAGASGRPPLTEPAARGRTGSVEAALEENAADKESFTYMDKVYGLLLSYPIVFSSEGHMDEDGTVRFESRQDGAALLYWVIPNTYDEDPAEFRDRVSSAESKELAGNVVIAWGEDMNQETGETAPCAYYWVVDVDWIACVSIQCESPEDAARWYGLLENSAVYIENTAAGNGYDPYFNESVAD